MPNSRIAELEPAEVSSEEETAGTTVWSIGYPGWNLLYYSLYSSLFPEQEDVVVLETGTHRGISTIVMAQALADLGVRAAVETVELDADLAEDARRNVEKAGLDERVRFHVGDAIGFLSDAAERFDHFDFVLIDDDHTYEHVMKEIRIVCPQVAACGGKVYFDNAGWGEVETALRRLQEIFGGNVVHFDNCSWRPPGNAIWQPRLTGMVARA